MATKPKEVALEEALSPSTTKLKEVDTIYGPGLGRVIDVPDEHAKALLAHQVKTGLVCWEIADEKEPVTEIEPVNA